MMAAEETERITIRGVTAPDLEAIVGIERQSFGDPWGESDFTEISASPHGIFLVAAALDGVVAGYGISVFVQDESEILNLAVGPLSRGRGIGGALLDSMLAELGNRGVHSVFLEVRESNERARRLYESRGFSEMSRRSRYYRNPVEDALILRLELKR